MIPAIDLRIGNWVNLPGQGLFEIKSGGDIDMAATKGAEAIPLTEELLVSLGFTQLGKSSTFEIHGKDFRYDLKMQHIAICHPSNMLWHTLTTHIASLHQLQNIFYCIIGHDLKLPSVQSKSLAQS